MGTKWAWGVGVVGLVLGSASGLTQGANDEKRPTGDRELEVPQPVQARLMAEHATIQPGGSTRLGIRFQIEPGWHIYAQEPGDAGLPTKVTWVVPEEVSVEPLQWPTHTSFLDPGNIRTFGYEGSAVLSSRMHLAASAPTAHPIPVGAKVSWLACKELCLPGSAELSVVLPVSSETPAVSADAALFPPATEAQTATSVVH